MKDDPAARLRHLRVRAGFVTAADAARAMTLPSPVTYQHHENGRRAISRKAAETYGRFFGVPAGMILYGETLQEAHRIAILGTVGANGVVSMQPDGRLGYVKGPPADTRPLISLVVDTDDLFPRYSRGDLVFYEPPAPLPPDLAALNGRFCVVQTTDGRTMIRMLTHNGGDRCTLVALAGPPLLNVQVAFAAPILWTRSAEPDEPMQASQAA